MQANIYMPSERETALLLARLAEEKEERRHTEVKNLRLSKATFQKVSNRKMLSPEFLGGVQQWLLHCGWVLFEAGQVFGLVRLKTVENWPRCNSQRSTKLCNRSKRANTSSANWNISWRCRRLKARAARLRFRQ